MMDRKYTHAHSQTAHSGTVVFFSSILILHNFQLDPTSVFKMLFLHLLHRAENYYRLRKHKQETGHYIRKRKDNS